MKYIFSFNNPRRTCINEFPLHNEVYDSHMLTNLIELKKLHTEVNESNDIYRITRVASISVVDHMYWFSNKYDNVLFIVCSHCFLLSAKSYLFNIRTDFNPKENIWCIKCCEAERFQACHILHLSCLTRVLVWQWKLVWENLTLSS